VGEDRPGEGAEGGVLSPDDGAARKPRTVYGRRQGRPIRAGRQRLLDDLLPQITVKLPPEGGRLDPAALFTPPLDDLWLEIGFGGGEHLAALAQARSGTGFIGCEPFLNGVSTLLKHITDHGLGNVRILGDDARLVLAALPDDTLGRAFILHPDPWPKKRHHRRRIVCQPVLDELARTLRPGSELRLATDHAEYGEWMLAEMAATPHFTLVEQWRTPGRPDPADWPPSRYEQKALRQGIPCLYLKAVRKPK
jgi:tRNA (guanine-N7-)-methyltransferase